MRSDWNRKVWGLVLAAAVAAGCANHPNDKVQPPTVARDAGTADSGAANKATDDDDEMTWVIIFMMLANQQE